MADWQQPPENSLLSLAHGISNSDGIELDLRFTADNELIIHHDAKVSVNKQLLDNRNPYVESWELDELHDFGFCSFRQMLEHKDIMKNWHEEGKMIYDALRNRKADGGIMDLGGLEKDYREGGFVPLGEEERADDVPARLSKNEFVFTADAVRNAGGGDIDKGAEVMQNMMDNLEAGGMISEESQGKENPAQAMFDQAQMLESRII